MTKTVKTAWTAPALRKLGTIKDVAAGKPTNLAQAGNNGTNFS